MKMKTKGIATAAIAVIVVIVVAVVGIGVYLLIRKPSATGIEAISGSTEVSSIGDKSVTGLMSDLIAATPPYLSISEDKLAEVFAFDVYKITESVTNIVNHYKSKWQGEGYTLIYSENYDLPAMGIYYVGCGYFKGDQIVGVVAMTYQNENYYILYAASKSAAGELFGMGEGEGEGVIGLAMSLDFWVDSTYDGQATTRYRARNIGTPNMDLRMDYTVAEMTMSCILSGSQQQGWINYGTEWGSFSDLGMNFSEMWSQYYGGFTSYIGFLSGWTSGERLVTYGGVTYRIYDIQVNPTLPDDVFQPG